MQAQIDAIEYLLSHRLAGVAAIDAEERGKCDALLVRVVTRLRSKANNIYVSLV